MVSRRRVGWNDRVGAHEPCTTKEDDVTRRSAGILTVAAMMLAFLLLTGTRAWSDAAVETIVFVRHGEKPDKGLGQLDCQGLNRALALPAVIAKTFGQPIAVFAPDPSQQRQDDGVAYDYVRPLATIEPTAIFFGLPIKADFGVNDTDGLRAALEQPAYRNALVVVAWEHTLIETIVRGLLGEHGGDVAGVPKWHGDDFDSIYVVTITGAGAAAKASLVVRREGLDGQPTACPH
jgi:hypothetical protein